MYTISHTVLGLWGPLVSGTKYVQFSVRDVTPNSPVLGHTYPRSLNILLQSVLFSFNLFYFTSIGVLPTCMSVWGCWSHHRQMWAAMWVPGIELKSSGRAFSALNLRTISPAWGQFFSSHSKLLKSSNCRKHWPLPLQERVWWKVSNPCPFLTHFSIMQNVSNHRQVAQLTDIHGAPTRPKIL